MPAIKVSHLSRHGRPGAMSGDIDLFIETDDILLKDGRTQEADIFGVARQNGVRL